MFSPNDPAGLSLWCTHSWSCPFLSLLTKIVTSSTLPPPSPPPVFSSDPPFISLTIMRINPTLSYSILTFINIVNNDVRHPPCSTGHSQIVCYLPKMLHPYLDVVNMLLPCLSPHSPPWYHACSSSWGNIHRFCKHGRKKPCFFW